MLDDALVRMLDARCSREEAEEEKIERGRGYSYHYYNT